MEYRFCGYYWDKDGTKKASEKEIVTKGEKMKNPEITLTLDELKNVDLQALITSKVNSLDEGLTLYCKCEPKEN